MNDLRNLIQTAAPARIRGGVKLSVTLSYPNLAPFYFRMRWLVYCCHKARRLLPPITNQFIPKVLQAA